MNVGNKFTKIRNLKIPFHIFNNQYNLYIDLNH